MLFRFLLGVKVEKVTRNRHLLCWFDSIKYTPGLNKLPGKPLFQAVCKRKFQT